MQNPVARSLYPGASASPGQMLDLAQAYLAAAYKLMNYDTGNPLQSAPMRLICIQAIELYLNAFLLSAGESPATVRALQHDLGKRSKLAIDAGLALRKRTEAHLLSLTSGREYLTSRYGPELASDWSQQSALITTVKEVSGKVHPVVRAAIIRQHAEERFRSC